MWARAVSSMIALLGWAAALAAQPASPPREPSAPSELATLVARHADAEALALLEGLPPTPAHRYLRGRLFERGGRLPEASRAYAAALRESATPLPGAVAADARFRRARLLVRLGRCTDARPIFEAAALTGARQGIARALVVECDARSALRAGAADALEALLPELERVTRDTSAVRGVDTFSLRALRAEILGRLGRASDAREARLALFIEQPDHPDSAQLVASLGAEDTAGVLGQLTPAQRLARADALFSAHRFEDAALTLRGVEPPAELRGAWLHRFGMSLYRARHHYAEAARVLAASARVRHPHAQVDAFHAARALARADRDAEAIVALRRFVRAHPRAAQAPRAEILAAWLEARLGRGAAARRALGRFLSGPRAAMDDDARRDAHWQLGMEAFDSRRFVEAARHFEAYAQGSQAALVGGRGFYWAGRAHHEGGRAAAAIRAYERARSFDPIHWYALWATRRLLELAPETSAAPSLRAPAREGGEAEPAIPPVASFFLALGLRADAIAHARAQERGDATARVALRRAVGDVEGAYRLAAQQSSRLRERPEDGARWAWEAAYPRPFEQHVRREAGHHGVPWEHVYATMRQESAFDPDAVSGADAIGLLQVLPSSAARVARSLGVPFHRDRLFDPIWNVRIGVAEMAALWRRYDGVLPLIIAAYNAGAARVDRWLREEAGNAPLALDLFVERIPFDETRGYVRRVISHFARYRYLERPAGGLDVPLPATVSEPAESESDASER